MLMYQPSPPIIIFTFILTVFWRGKGWGWGWGMAGAGLGLGQMLILEN
jgi:hypothetical protein